MKRNFILFVIALSLGIISLKIERSSAKKSKGVGNVHSRSLAEDSVSSEPSKVYYGIPLLYQQRQELARDLGVDPIVTMSDFLFREHHPLFPQGFMNNHMDDYHSDDPEHSDEDEKRPRRKKRGIIANKIQKFKKGIHSAKKKIWKIKQKAVSIVKGKNKNTPKPKYESTGGTWPQPVTQGWSRSHRETYNSPATYGSGYGSHEYGASGPVGRQSAATVHVGWAKTYSPTDGRSSRSNYGRSNIEGIHLTYGPPKYKAEPNYKGLAVRNKVPPY